MVGFFVIIFKLKMLEFIIDLFVNILCFNVGFFSIKIISLGRFCADIKTVKYPYAIALLGLLEIILVIFSFIFVLKDLG